jgi:hypothetical protein
MDIVTSVQEVRGFQMEGHMAINVYLCKPDKYPKATNEQPVTIKNMDVLAVI